LHDAFKTIKLQRNIIFDANTFIWGI
jgi:hypothetical protein